MVLDAGEGEYKDGHALYTLPVKQWKQEPGLKEEEPVASVTKFCSLGLETLDGLLAWSVGASSIHLSWSLNKMRRDNLHIPDLETD